MSALLHLINHVIQQNPQQQQALAALSTQCLGLNLVGFHITACINEQGFLEPTHNNSDTQITFHNSAIQKILQGEQPGVGDIAIDGDVILGMAVLPILGSLRYYAHDDLNRVFGSLAAEAISSSASNIGHTIKKMGLSIVEQISDFAKEPESPVMDQATLLAWIEEVDKLRDDVARLNTRLDRLEKDIWL